MERDAMNLRGEASSDAPWLDLKIQRQEVGEKHHDECRESSG
jgi:hypothetical protein